MMHKIVNGVEIPLTAEEIADYEAKNLLVAQKQSEQIVAMNKAVRNQKLKETDWTQLSDVSLTSDCKVQFMAYRQVLRDLDMLDPTWPDVPEEVWVS